ncbi:pyridoxal phosphate-dependent aminotransferase [Gracilinema caldarium]|uniref:pyridoxal phosphate-dependent aminotransferase n=1 Tax=Gracilinema caldarium TaxID=215591 RepID=UPI0026EDC846|nr:pyridoxal phosphate-dependent aminotransferase [Gracilinema caldarium]
MRRDIVHPGAGQLRYEIREIVSFARELGRWNVPITWENIGDPVKKGEPVAEWIKDIVRRRVMEDLSYAYSDTEGVRETREFLAGLANQRSLLNPLGAMECSAAPLVAEDIIFFNGLGDAVAKVFGFLRREARVLGPSPAYSTLSSAEAAHSGYDHLTYRLDPENNWMPDLEDVELKVKYNDAIAGLLLINPDNPTGAVYPVEVLTKLVAIAKKYGLFIIADETYANIVFPGNKTAALSQVIGDVPGLALRSISKEVPWPGARSGWIEVYNKNVDPQFSRYVQSLVDSKRLEVCSTTLPQLCIPDIMGDSRYSSHLERRAQMFAERADEAEDAFASVRGLRLIKPRGALYATALFDTKQFFDGKEAMRRLPVADKGLEDFITERTKNVAPDKRFVYWLLAATGICVVPLSGFVSELPGFRFTLLEQDKKKRTWIYKTLAEKAEEYLGSI